MTNTLLLAAIITSTNTTRLHSQIEKQVIYGVSEGIFSFFPHQRWKHTFVAILVRTVLVRMHDKTIFPPTLQAVPSAQEISLMRYCTNIPSPV